MRPFNQTRKRRLVILLVVILLFAVGYWMWWGLPEPEVEIIWTTPGIYTAVHVHKESDLLVAIRDKEIVRVDLGTGEILWAVPLPARGNQYDFAARRSSILVSAFGSVYRFDPENGGILWKTPVADVKWNGKLHLGSMEGSVAVSLEGAVTLLDLSSGVVRWMKKIKPRRMYSTPHRLILVEQTGEEEVFRMRAFNLEDGVLVWEPSNPLRYDEIMDLPDSHGVIHVAPKAAVCINLRTGEEKWRLPDAKYAKYYSGDLLVYYTNSGEEALADVVTGEDRSELVPEDMPLLIEATRDRLYWMTGGETTPPGIRCVERSTRKILWEQVPPRMRLSPGVWGEAIPPAFPSRLWEHEGWIEMEVAAGTGIGFGSYATYYRLDAYSDEGEFLWAFPLAGSPVWKKGGSILCWAHPFPPVKTGDDAGLFRYRIRELERRSAP